LTQLSAVDQLLQVHLQEGGHGRQLLRVEPFDLGWPLRALQYSVDC
jgi:hypothetical protein